MGRRGGRAKQGRRLVGVVMALAAVGVGATTGGAAADTTAPAGLSPIPLSGVKAVSTGNGFFLALLNDGTVRAFGVNNFGQLGNGSTRNSTLPVVVKGLTGVVAISAGGFHSLALLGNGTVMAWGNDQVGQLGNGQSETFSDVPVPVSGLTGVKAVSAGGAHSLALLNDGTMRAWGLNTSGQLGDGNASQQFATLPVTVSNVAGAVAISAGARHSLAVVGGGSVLAWGSNSNGQLGNGNIEITDSFVPQPVVSLQGATGVYAGDLYSLARLSDGTAMGWGDDQIGELGNGFNPPFYTVPQKVANLTTATALAASDPIEVHGQGQGAEVSFALLADHTVDDWGATRRLNESPTPTGVKNVAAISPGLFLLTNGTVMRFTP